MARQVTKKPTALKDEEEEEATVVDVEAEGEAEAEGVAAEALARILQKLSRRFPGL